MIFVHRNLYRCAIASKWGDLLPVYNNQEEAVSEGGEGEDSEGSLTSTDGGRTAMGGAKQDHNMDTHALEETNNSFIPYDSLDHTDSEGKTNHGENRDWNEGSMEEDTI